MVVVGFTGARRAHCFGLIVNFSTTDRDHIYQHTIKGLSVCSCITLNCC